jgi:solute carrier family 25 aspartate/glutamate transporter 12/13
MEIVKVRLQTQSKDGVPKTMVDIVRELGVLGLYRGAGITMARDVPSSAIFFACYTLLQQLYPDQNFMAGCLAAIPATVLVTPMDIIKTRLQVWTHFGTTLSFSIFCVVFIICADYQHECLYIMRYRLYSCVVVRSINGVQVDWWGLLLEQKEPTPGEEPYRDWLQCLQLLVEREGPQALFKGSLVRVIRTSPQFGITLTLYSLFFNGS